jgi:hypothetical protein
MDPYQVRIVLERMTVIQHGVGVWSTTEIDVALHGKRFKGRNMHYIETIQASSEMALPLQGGGNCHCENFVRNAEARSGLRSFSKPQEREEAFDVYCLR